MPPTLPTLPPRVVQVPCHYNDGRRALAKVKLLPQSTTPTIIMLHEDGIHTWFVKVGDRAYYEATFGVGTVGYPQT